MSDTIAHASAGRYVGQAVLRKEDPRLLTGRGRYNDDGNPLASTFMDYLVPTAHEIPEIETFHIESPASTVGGYKGVGEGGAIGAPAALFNAVADALAQHGITVLDQPLDPDTILRKIREATK